MRTKILVLTTLLVTALGVSTSALAELPTSVDCRYRVARLSGNRFFGARHRFGAVLNTTLGLGESCEVTHNACGSAFIPEDLAPQVDTRRCVDFTEIGVSELGAGDNSVVARAQSRVVVETKASRGRQLTYGVDVVCTDGITSTSFSCEPRARKVSVNGQPGVSISRAIRQVRKNFRG